MSDKGTRRRRWPDGYDPRRTRAQLVASALRLFEAQGFDRTTLQQIVEDASLTKGALYHHFHSKEDLLFQLQDEHLDSQLEQATAIVAAEPDPVARMRALIRLSLVAVARHRPHVAIFHQERRHLTGERLEQITRKRDELDAIFRGTVQAGMDAGEFRTDISAQIATYSIVGMCAWAFQWYSSEGQLTIEQLADQFSTVIFDGLFSG